MPGAVAFPGGSFYTEKSVPGFREFSDSWPAVVEITFDHQNENFITLKDEALALRGALAPVRLQKLLGSEQSETVIMSLDLKMRLASATLDHEMEDDEWWADWDNVTSESLSASYAFDPSSKLPRRGHTFKMEFHLKCRNTMGKQSYSTRRPCGPFV
ncbi:hypothetical protein M433DRAFT_23408 [Acidomyces richmondensis BFW]|nr:MAG: hypothetical protein FE78DRAFT_30101 [Acidomyces sp. 'richmondensis']KYG46874.1 hypothetical protein M433DRAFT_23408 [Acidomyces richmondensis BFW]